MIDKRKLKIGFTKSGNEGISTRIILPISWINRMGITEDNRDVEAYYDTEKNRIVIENFREIVGKPGSEKYLCVFGNDEFETGKWPDGTKTLGYKTNPTAKQIKEGDIIFLYLKGCNLKGIYKVLPKEQWRKVDNWSRSATQFTIKPIVELDKPVDFRTLIGELSFTKFLGNKWMGAIQGHSGIRLLSIEDSEVLKKSILDAHKK